MTDIHADKEAARKAALARRAAAHAKGHPAQAALLAEVLADHRGAVLSGYMAMRSEIDPITAMAAHALHGSVAVPVIAARATPLRFARWTPRTPMIDGAFGARVPKDPEWLIPQVLIVPLLAFDRRGGRLGYGGGYYDRTLADLRGRETLIAIGFAWAAQEAPNLPLEVTDQPLDLIVTEAEVIRPGNPL